MVRAEKHDTNPKPNSSNINCLPQTTLNKNYIYKSNLGITIEITFKLYECVKNMQKTIFIDLISPTTLLRKPNV